MVWTGAHASIPSGWARETTLDDKFAKGWGAEAVNTTGGATTHTHTSPTHTHNLAAHTHTYQTSAADTGTINGHSGGSGVVRGTHYHTGTTGTLASTYATGTTAGTYGSVSNDPPYRKVIFIKASAGASLATNIVALWGASDTAPTNWSKVTELAGRYLKGASTGADADLATDNGSSTNIHDFTHTHTAPGAHGHSNSTSSTATTSAGWAQETSGADRVPDHTHTVAINTATTDINQYASTLTTAETVEPLYRRLHAIKKGASGVKVSGIIGMWLGAVGSIPAGWSLYTAMQDNHLKIGDPTTSATGGSNTHTHAAQGHVHTGTAHTHTHSSISTHTGDRQPTGGTDLSDLLSTGKEHTGNTVANANTTYASTDTTADSSSNEPAYRTVAFIRFDKEVNGGAMLLFSLIN